MGGGIGGVVMVDFIRLGRRPRTCLIFVLDDFAGTLDNKDLVLLSPALVISPELLGFGDDDNVLGSVIVC